GGGHQVAVLRHLRRAPRLLDEGHVAPGLGAQGERVVVGLARELAVARRHLVPLLARDLAGLAADAHRGVGEEPDARPGLGAVAHRSRTPARSRYSATSAVRADPRGRRPGRMSQVAALYSLMCTLRSRASGRRSLAESPV